MRKLFLEWDSDLFRVYPYRVGNKFQDSDSGLYPLSYPSVASLESGDHLCPITLPSPERLLNLKVILAEVYLLSQDRSCFLPSLFSLLFALVSRSGYPLE
jgi:hypothetical protein